MKRSTLHAFSTKRLVNNDSDSYANIFLVIRNSVHIDLLSRRNGRIALFQLNRKRYYIAATSYIVQRVSFSALMATAQRSALLIIPVNIYRRLTGIGVRIGIFVLRMRTRHCSRIIHILRRVLFEHLSRHITSCLIRQYQTTRSVRLQVARSRLTHSVGSTHRTIAHILHHLTSRNLVRIGHKHVLILSISNLTHLP